MKLYYLNAVIKDIFGGNQSKYFHEYCGFPFRYLAGKKRGSCYRYFRSKIKFSHLKHLKQDIKKFRYFIFFSCIIRL